MNKRFLAVMSLMVLPATGTLGQQSAPTAAATPSNRLMGDVEIKTALVGHTISGTNNDGQDYTETFNADGSLKISSTQSRGSSFLIYDAGKWRLDGNKMCIKYDHWQFAQERCFQVSVDQGGGTHYASSGQGFRIVH